MTNPWNTADITGWLYRSSEAEEENWVASTLQLRDALAIAVEALSLPEEDREEALDEIREILGIPT